MTGRWGRLRSDDAMLLRFGKFPFLQAFPLDQYYTLWGIDAGLYLSFGHSESYLLFPFKHRQGQLMYNVWAWGQGFAPIGWAVGLQPSPYLLFRIWQKATGKCRCRFSQLKASTYLLYKPFSVSHFRILRQSAKAPSCDVGCNALILVRKCIYLASNRWTA